MHFAKKTVSEKRSELVKILQSFDFITNAGTSISGKIAAFAIKTS